jgi:hypothetical protein
MDGTELAWHQKALAAPLVNLFLLRVGNQFLTPLRCASAPLIILLQRVRRFGSDFQSDRDVELLDPIHCRLQTDLAK